MTDRQRSNSGWELAADTPALGWEELFNRDLNDDFEIGVVATDADGDGLADGSNTSAYEI